MAGYFFVALATLSLSVTAAPSAQQGIYQQYAPAHQQQPIPLEYYLQNPDVVNYNFRSAQQKQAGAQGESARLESLEPDSEVELVPGVQQPQQPPQQNPVAPNIPGLLPGQRVFIVHMPVPGYSPGTIGGYQPVYIVAAAPQGNAAYPGNGFQNAFLLNPSGQAVGYTPRGAVPPQLLRGFALQRPFDLGYQDAGLRQANGGAIQGNAGRESIRFSNQIGLQRSVNPADYQGPVMVIQSSALNKQRQAGSPEELNQVNEEQKEAYEHKANFRGTAALQRNKA
ncbi:unnamed protein product [Arctia plantaginis]|uniref:Uncharacterized protein n=1 Tax=Arctia plantaginis TaxID=874455 RepID=A0A8S0Z5X8_ARCPL|nr:unnamed protein product [Arctia plantaginis]CAB3234212.1 unnamed protein product [Arctia plantaginis]